MTDSLTPPPRSFIRRVGVPIALLALGLGGFMALVKSKPKPKKVVAKETPLLVDTMVASTQPVKITINAQGVTIPSRQVAIKSEVTGRVIWTSSKLRPGGVFKAGEAIVKLDPRDYEIAVAQQKAALGRAEVELQLERGRKNVAEREWALMKKKAKGSALALREPQLASAQLALEAAESGLRRAELNLDRTTSRAPFDAFVIQKSVDVGELVTIQTPLGSMASSDSFWVEVKVPARKLPWISFPNTGTPGSKARVQLDFGGEKIQRAARVLQLAGDLDPVGRMARVIVEIDDPFGLNQPDSTLPLLLGSFVSVDIASEKALTAVAIPRSALLEGNKVMILGDNQRLEIRDVAIAWREQETIFSTRGVRAGERVIRSKINRPVEGMLLKPLGQDEVDPAQAAAPDSGTVAP
ncbi:MAG: efflux RND transporter periplasmic adaptor subunit [Myxococcota bacterium]|nr:efflux RND transporter periplasmic adaptor subunit [Myxococcota bacterium]